MKLPIKASIWCLRASKVYLLTLIIYCYDYDKIPKLLFVKCLTSKFNFAGLKICSLKYSWGPSICPGGKLKHWLSTIFGLFSSKENSFNFKNFSKGAALLHVFLKNYFRVCIEIGLLKKYREKFKFLRRQKSWAEKFKI